jgi:2-oxoglutarate ferredoxin oxidoreductase subunit beta
MMNQVTEAVALTKRDFESDQEARWCPGCGSYRVLAAIQKLLPTLGIRRENFAFISGIGCSSRFPYYMNTYGMHSIHGRAPAIATGLKLARPDLSVWVVTGDGDALAIGGNHLIHALRRNVDIKIVLFNNRIYGLTKGQCSPTSEQGQKTKSTPFGSIDRPFSPVPLALGAGGTFVARTIDNDLGHMNQVFERAAAHKGTAFVEVLQTCPVFNDGAYAAITEKTLRNERRLLLEDGKPLVFGTNRDKGLRLKGLSLEVAKIVEGSATGADIAVHDETAEEGGLATLLGQLTMPDFPVPLGVFRDVNAPTYDDLNGKVHEEANAAYGPGDLATLLRGSEIWIIE